MSAAGFAPVPRRMRGRTFCLSGLWAVLVCWCVAAVQAEDVTPRVTVDTPEVPPTWALLERELLRQSSAACREFFDRYFDERGFLLCVERWGGDDGPDDAIENCLHWPVLHALGGSDDVLRMYKHAWEGHLRQYTLARTREVPLARDGMYYKEFPTQFDWLHHAEGLVVFCLQGLSDPEDPALTRRMRRFAGFYTGDDPQAHNYDTRHKIIRSMFTGSRGPLLRKATGLDWAGDPIEVEHRFELGHGERTYAEMVAHFKDYNDIIGDHPQNMLSTALAVNSFLLTGESRYRDWVLDYVGAWRQRMIDNQFVIPTNIGLEGTIGGATGGRWYGGVYGWAFTVEVPQTGAPAHRNTHYLGLHGFQNAYLLTGDDRYLDPWRRQIDVINGQQKMIDGRPHYPTMYGPDGWYNFTPQPYRTGVEQIAWMTMRDDDRQKVGTAGWWGFLAGRAPDFPVQALQSDLQQVRQRVAGMRADQTTPDTRLADDPLRFNPAAVESLIRLTTGGLVPGRQGLIFHCRLRYFDPITRRAGLPPDCAALIEHMDADTTIVRLVNVNQLESRTLSIQGGAYGEHQLLQAKIADETIDLNSRTFTLTLAPGAGTRITLTMDRYSNQPTLKFPWNRR